MGFVLDFAERGRLKIFEEWNVTPLLGHFGGE